jgi:signal transduction histidine kinase
MITIVRDVSKRIEGEQRLRETTGSAQRAGAILEAVGKAAASLLRNASFDEAAGDVLARIGVATQASRVYIFEDGVDDEGESVWCLRHRWMVPGLETPGDAAQLQSFRYLPDFARWPQILREGGVIASHVSQLPEREQPGHAAFGAKSILVVPIAVAGEWWGFVGIDACDAERVWSEAEIDALRAAAGILGAAIQRERTEDALLKSEEQLRHAQRMDALGRFVGGIAHDFNNILLAIKGYTEMALLAFDSDPDAARSDVVEVHTAAERAAALTRQLLQFGRRQPALPRVVDLNRVVTDIERMLRRLTGERIELLTVLECATPTIRADVGQLEQVLTNLAVNARDAMIDGGRLTIETRDVVVGDRPSRLRGGLAPGHYVLLAVSDTGTGMDEKTIAHIFEPFFTTKEPGKGTGLGLATVYGIVQKRDGTILVASEPGRGTTFEIYLPVVDSPVTDVPRAPERNARGGSETVLVVEDEEQVRSLVVAILEQHGYRVLSAASAEDALAALEKSDREQCGIDLLITDVVMPGMSGRELVARLASSRRELKALYVTGYDAETNGHRAADTNGVPLLAKPFAPAELAEKVREILGSP